MNQIREIITRAIIGKGKKRTKTKYTFSLEGVTKILGCWISCHRYEAAISNGIPQVIGVYDLHVWYSNEDGKNCALYKTQISYQEDMEVIKKENRIFNNEDGIEAICTLEPKCVDACLANDQLVIEVEKEMLVQIIGDATLRIKVHQEEETWDIDNLVSLNDSFID
ncbi:outer spore coat protein CotE [Tannockella kyphosi]|uniref:outer spore coat protein CotE n=1 Tax=Tannockella kyphosi TaxID=2899121 RepID=UPI002011FC2C|nr:outer spore coat protein CotE [Tannockella kyphosi]